MIDDLFLFHLFKGVGVLACRAFLKEEVVVREGGLRRGAAEARKAFLARRSVRYLAFSFMAISLPTRYALE